MRLKKTSKQDNKDISHIRMDYIILVVALVIGSFTVFPEVYETYKGNQNTQFIFPVENYEQLAEPEHALSNYKVDGQYTGERLGLRGYLETKGNVNGVPISHKQRITRDECRIQNFEVSEKGILYSLKNRDVNSGNINAKDVEQCLVRYFAMLSEVSEETTAAITEQKRLMIEREINRSSFVKAED